MMRNLRVSIIIPCYNAERFIGDAIRSALTQTYPRVEVVVVDDGSTDGSLEVIRSFGDQIRWESGRNQGGCAARNRGLAMARGELIQFLDADDILHPTKLEVQVPKCSETPRSITYTDYEVRDFATNEWLTRHSKSSAGQDAVVFVLITQRLQTSAPLHWRKALLEIGGFRECLPCAQEYDLHLRLACSGHRFVHVKKALFTVRTRQDGVSSDSMRVIDQHADICRVAQDLLADREELTPQRGEAMAVLLASDARVYVRSGLFDRAARYFNLAREFHPGGGISGAYSPATRMLRSLLGDSGVERAVSLKRNLATRFAISGRRAL